MAPVVGGHGHEGVEVAVGEGGGFVDDEDGAGVEGEVLGVVVGEVPGDGLALDPGRGGEGAGGFALHGGADDAVAGGGPGVGAAATVVVLPAPARPMAAWKRWPLAHQARTRSRCSSVRCGCVRERGVDGAVGDEVRRPGAGPCVNRATIRSWTSSISTVVYSGSSPSVTRDDVAGGEELVGQRLEPARRRPAAAGARRRAAGTGWLASAASASARVKTDPPAQIPSGAASDANSASGSGVSTVEGAVDAGGERRRASRPRRAARSRQSSTRSSTGVWCLGGSGAQHDVFDLARDGRRGRSRLRARGGRRRSRCAAGRTRASTGRRSRRSPSRRLRPGRQRTPRLRRELVAHLGGGERGGGVGVPVEAAGVEGAVGAVGES